MAAPTPNEADFFRRAEPARALRGAASPAELDQFRRGEPFAGAPMGAAPAAASARSQAVVIG